MASRRAKSRSGRTTPRSRPTSWPQPRRSRPAIIDGRSTSFTGPINDNTGTERVAAGDIIDDGEFWAVDWYAEGVEAP